MMIVSPERVETATALNAPGGNGVWKKPESLADNEDGQCREKNIK
jgi:hypothetical protein